MGDYPEMTDHRDTIERVPRRVRAYLGGQLVIDTISARYVWEHVRYPQYYIPVADVTPGVLVEQRRTHRSRWGLSRDHGVRVGGVERPGAARVFGDDATREPTPDTPHAVDGVAGMVRFEWAALDAWFEEDEEVFVHPRNPYTRVDALRSTRSVRVEFEGVAFAEAASTVMVFETGLPTRYYFDKTAVDFDRLIRTDTATECPYKGRTTDYWSARSVGVELADIAWSYAFPTRQLLPIAGLVAFYNEKLDIIVDGQREDRPITPFS